MKHKPAITILLLSMFLATQLIGLWVVDSYNQKDLPYGLETPDEDPATNFASLIFSFVFAFALIFILMKYKWKWIIRAWFFFVITLALALALNAFLKNYVLAAGTVSFFIAVSLAYLKVFRPNVYIHNATELLIYPGIAAVFVPILTPTSAIALLLIISLYDMWAVWKSGVMQKMAKFQMEEIKVFGGFLVPTVSKKVRAQIKNIRQKYKGKKIPNSVKNKKFKVNLAILGGGDVIFPIITSGVFMRSFGLAPSLFIMFGSLVGLTGLFLITKKGKAYPAMPYISAGIFAGLIIWRAFFF